MKLNLQANKTNLKLSICSERLSKETDRQTDRDKVTAKWADKQRQADRQRQSE